MKFATFYDKQASNTDYISNSGSEFENVYGYEIDKVTGIKSLVKKKKTNIKEYIQSFADSVDINKMMLRFQDGEVDVFDKVKGIYADVTDFPSTYAELFARVEECNSIFSDLPTDIKEKFNNSPTEFWTQYGSPEFNNKIFPKADDVINPVVDPIPVVDNVNQGV